MTYKGEFTILSKSTPTGIQFLKSLKFKKKKEIDRDFSVVDKVVPVFSYRYLDAWIFEKKDFDTAEKTAKHFNLDSEIVSTNEYKRKVNIELGRNEKYNINENGE